MPKRKLTRTLSYYPGRGQPVKSKRTLRRTYARIPRPITSGGAFPKRKIAYIAYSDSFSLSYGIGGTAATHTFCVNDIFDPDLSGVGHQPLGRDQLADIYGRYQVLAATIRVDFVATASGSAGTAVCGIDCTDDPTAETNRDTLVERPRSVYKMLSDSDSGPATCQVWKKWTLWNDVGATAYNNQGNYGANTGVSPGHRQFFHVYASSPTGTAGACQAVIRINYRVMFTEPKPLTAS